MPVQYHWNQYDGIAQEYGENGLPPVHAALDERTGHHIRWNAQAHANPQGSIIPRIPGSFRRGYGR